MKRVVTLMLAVVLAFGMVTAGSAAAPKITGFASGFGYYEGSVGASGTLTTGSVHLNTIRPDATLKLYMTVDQFQWEGDNKPNPAKLTSSHLSNYKLTVKRKVSKGSNVLKDVTLERDSDYMYIKVEFVDEWVGTSDQDFDFTVYLAKSSSKQAVTELQITGTMANDDILLDENDNEVDLSDGQYAKAEAYIKSIRVYTGNGLYINTKMFDGKKYYAKSTQEITSADDELLREYPEIETIYTLNTVNMTSAGNTVEFELDAKYYVYNAEGRYVGTTADKLPFSSKYYLASSKIVIKDGSTTGEIPAEGGEPADPDAPPTEGGNSGGNSSGVNPITGGNSYISLAVVVGLGALAVAGAASRKK